MHTRFIATFGAFALLGAGCASQGDDSAPDHETGRVSIDVAPLSINGSPAKSCYDIAVTDSLGKAVWSQNDVCTDTFGHGADGSLAIVGICDASSPFDRVQITLTGIWDAAGASHANWAEPPQWRDDHVPCVANKDTELHADFTVLTQGETGFLDVSIATEAIACNAKIDCVSDFLHEDADDDADDGMGRGDDRGRDRDDCGSGSDADGSGSGSDHCGDHDGTIVVGLACSGDNGKLASLYVDDLVLTCSDATGHPVVVDFDPSSGNGWADGFPDDFVFGVQTNAGVQNGESFWTIALGIRSGWTGCSLSTRLGATDGQSMTATSEFPFISANDVGFGFDNGTFECTANPLDGTGSALTSGWGSGDDLDFQACLVPAAGAPSGATIGLCGGSLSGP